VGDFAPGRRRQGFYDLLFDKDLIEASFAMQYKIRLSREDMPTGEFLRLLRGIMPDTPLGRIVAIRAETDSGRIAKFGQYEKAIRRDWQRFIGHQTNAGDIQNILKKNFGGE